MRQCKCTQETETSQKIAYDKRNKMQTELKVTTKHKVHTCAKGQRQGGESGRCRERLWSRQCQQNGEAIQSLGSAIGLGHVRDQSKDDI
jgi:hypothetical protein